MISVFPFRDNVARARDALELEETTANATATGEKLSVGWEELQDLKGVWQELSKIWDQVRKKKPSNMGHMKPH